MNEYARRQYAAAVFVLLIAAAMRLVNLQTLPPGLSQDEVLNGDIVEGILAGRFALFFREGFGHEPLYHYYAAPFQALLGDNFLSIRLPAVFLGIVAVALTIAIARRDFGVWVGLGAGLFMAVDWWAVVFGRIGLRPIMMPIWLLLAAGHWRRRPLLAVSLLALVTYTYTPGVVFLLLPTAVWSYQKITHQTPRRALTVLLPLLIYLPLFIYLRANPELLQRGQQLSGPVDALRNGDFRPILHNLWLTLGTFAFSGDPRWSYRLPNTPFFDWFTAAIFLAGLIVTFVRWRRFSYGLLLLWLAFGLVPSIVTPDAPSSIRIIGAMPPTFIIVALGVQALARRTMGLRWQPLLFVVVAALIFGRSYRLHIQQWANAPTTRIEKYQSIYLDIADHIDQNKHHLVPIILDSSFAPIDADSIRRNLGYDPAARWAQGGTALALPATPARLYLPEFVAVQPALYAALELTPNRPDYRTVTVPSFATYDLPSRADIAPLAQPVVFEGQLVLVGFSADVANNTAISYWEVLQPLPDDLAIFLHLVSADSNAPLAQHDAMDAVAQTLRAGDRLLQLHTLDMTMANGDPIFNIGLYKRSTSQRLAIDKSERDYHQLHPQPPSPK